MQGLQKGEMPEGLLCEERLREGEEKKKIMFIGLHDSDCTGFPNYALIKIAAYHKARGDRVEWWDAITKYDKVYSSKVFTFTEENLYLPDKTIKGGTGYGIYRDLPQEIDDAFPDYSLYPDCDYAIGFLTRGCVNKCPWCVVPRKEGQIKPYRDWQDIRRNDTKRIVFMDNNVLASEHGVRQMEKMIEGGVRIDFNQGMEARRVTPEIAEIISRLKWIRFIRFACDTDAAIDALDKAVNLLMRYGVRADKIFVYMLITDDIVSAERRAIHLREIGVVPFGQPYRDFESNKEPTRDMKRMARWINRKAIFTECKTFAEYKRL